MPKETYQRKFSKPESEVAEEKDRAEQGEQAGKLLDQIFKSASSQEQLFTLAVQYIMKQLVSETDNKNSKLTEAVNILKDEIAKFNSKKDPEFPKIEIPKFPDSVKISNLDEIAKQVIPEFPKQIEVKAPNWLTSLLMKFPKLPEIFKVDLDKYRKDNNALAVNFAQKQFNQLLDLLGKVEAAAKKGQNYAFNISEVNLLNSAGAKISPAEKEDIESITLNNTSNRFQYISTAPETTGKYYMGGRLASATDLVLFANTTGKKVIVHGVSFSSSYAAEKEVDLHFGASGDNQGDAWYHNLAKDGGGNGFNMVNLPIEGIDDKGLYLDNSTGSYLYYSVWFEVINN